MPVIDELQVSSFIDMAVVNVIATGTGVFHTLRPWRLCQGYIYVCR